MSIKYLGENIDIHGGGQDLIFPHHQNEIAQSEAFTGKKPFVKYWLHNGFVNINQEKMSKSLGNFITIKEATEKYSTDVLRFFLISTQYRKPIDFNEDQMEMARRTLEKLYITLDFLEQYSEILLNLASEPIRKEMNSEEMNLLKKTREEFIEAMNNDFDSHNALLPLIQLSRVINSNMDKPESFSLGFIEQAFKLLLGLGAILGIFSEYTSESMERKRVHNLLTFLISIRNRARKEKNYELSDKIRDKLHSLGYSIKDFKTFSLFQKNIE